MAVCTSAHALCSAMQTGEIAKGDVTLLPAKLLPRAWLRSRDMDGRVRLVATVWAVRGEGRAREVVLNVNTYDAAVVLLASHECLQHFVRPLPYEKRAPAPSF